MDYFFTDPQIPEGSTSFDKYGYFVDVQLMDFDSQKGLWERSSVHVRGDAAGGDRRGLREDTGELRRLCLREGPQRRGDGRGHFAGDG
eukprot:15020480-Alexandrium_andersonii.AAC.1